MTRFRTIVKGQNPDGSWMDPVDLRCVGGPADGKWFSEPPAGYHREEVRGGAMWVWLLAYGVPGDFTPSTRQTACGMLEWQRTSYPHALPDEHP